MAIAAVDLVRLWCYLSHVVGHKAEKADVGKKVNESEMI